MNSKKSAIKLLATLSLMFIFSVLISTAAFAIDKDIEKMPWKSPIEKIQTILTGPIAKFVATVAVVGTGIGMAFGEGNNKKMLQLAFGASLAFGATTVITTVFAGVGGLGF